MEALYTEYGFRWGPVNVERFFYNDQKGWATIGLTTDKEEVQVYVTKTGKVRIHTRDGEWTPPKKKARR